jgi:DNA ligase 1
MFKPMLAKPWTPRKNPKGWLMSEKLDGMRALWDGDMMWTRTGKPIYVPDWFLSDFPDLPLDGELYIGRGRFQQTVSVARKHNPDDVEWQQVEYHVFDAPTLGGDFVHRLDLLIGKHQIDKSRKIIITGQQPCMGKQHMEEYLRTIMSHGGEGLILRDPRSAYEQRRSPAMLKVKPVDETEAEVLGYQPGEGKHLGRLGALEVRTGDVYYEVGTGFSDYERENPPPVGSVITVKHMGLTDANKPRFPAFKAVRGKGA